MLLTINHTTNYEYDDNLLGLIQTTKLTPSPSNGLKILDWTVKRNNKSGGEIFRDGEGNNIINFKGEPSEKEIKFVVKGEVETIDTNGVYESLNDKIDPYVYLRSTILTLPNDKIKELASIASKDCSNEDTVTIAHDLMLLIAKKIKYEPYTTNTNTTAAMSIDQEKGVCQDQAHIMISAARYLGIPSRYVNGYMHKNRNDSEFQATHAWAELYIDKLGWVGFDPTNQCCPDERYIRVSCGLDASYAAPIRGIFYGNTAEKLDINVQTIENCSQ